MIQTTCLAAFVAVLMPVQGHSQQTQSQCDELVALYVELAERSGETVTLEEARAKVLSENPTDAECGMMLALFPKEG